MLLYTMLYIVLAYLMLFAALTNCVCSNNASFFFLFKYFLCQGYELSGEIALKNNHYYYYYYYYYISHQNSAICKKQTHYHDIDVSAVSGCQQQVIHAYTDIPLTTQRPHIKHNTSTISEKHHRFTSPIQYVWQHLWHYYLHYCQSKYTMSSEASILIIFLLHQDYKHRPHCD